MSAGRITVRTKPVIAGAFSIGLITSLMLVGCYRHVVRVEGPMAHRYQVHQPNLADRTANPQENENADSAKPHMLAPGAGQPPQGLQMPGTGGTAGAGAASAAGNGAGDGG